MRCFCSPAVTSGGAAVVVCCRGRRERPRSFLQSAPFTMGGDLPPGRQHARAVQIRGRSFPRVRLGPKHGYSSCAPHCWPLARPPLPRTELTAHIPPACTNGPPGVCVRGRSTSPFH
eukprot:scaffold114462_cov46-Phaeocystis_antarctica.AAC.1